MCLNHQIGLVCILPQGHRNKGVRCCSGCIWSKAPSVLGEENVVPSRGRFCKQCAAEPVFTRPHGHSAAPGTNHKGSADILKKSPRSHSVSVRDVVYGGFQPQTKHLTTWYSAENDISKCIYWEIVKMYIILQAFNFNLHFLKLCKALINSNLLIHDRDPWLQFYLQNAAIAGILAHVTSAPLQRY